MGKRFKKFQARVIHSRSYKYFSNEYFRKFLLEKLSKEVLVNNNNGFQRFCDITTLNVHAPSKQKYPRGNQVLFLTKDSSKAIMARFRLRNKFLSKKTEEKALCVKQRNYCVSLLRKIKKKIYSNLDKKNVTDNRRF